MAWYLSKLLSNNKKHNCLIKYSSTYLFSINVEVKCGHAGNLAVFAYILGGKESKKHSIYNWAHACTRAHTHSHNALTGEYQS